MAKQHDSLFSGIEIGTRTIKVLIAAANAQNEFTVIGRGEAPSWKVMKGEITNAEIVEEYLTSAVRQAENEAGVSLCETCVGLCVSGSYVSVSQFTAEVNTDHAQEVKQADVDQVCKNARNKDISDKVVVLDTVAKYYTLADGRQLLNPIGQSSETLQTVLLVVMALRNRLATSCNCANKVIGSMVNDICYAPLGVGKACLPPDSVSHDGQIIVDIGAGVTSFCAFTMAGCCAIGQLTVGCDHAANDLALAFKLPIQSAQRLLDNLDRYNLNVMLEDENEHRLLDIDPGPGGQVQRIPVASIVKVIEARFEELLEIVAAKLAEDGAFSWASGSILLSGGGARLPGMLDLAQRVFGRTVVMAKPYGFKGPDDVIKNPAYMTVIGAVRKAKESLDIYLQQIHEEEDGQGSKTFMGRIIRTLFNA